MNETPRTAARVNTSTPPSWSSDIMVSEATSRQDRGAFIDLPYRAYHDMPSWRAPLRFERKAQIDPKHNPGLAGVDHALLLARRDGQVVGRIAAIVNARHLDIYNDATGQFGFFDTLTPDPDVVAALITAAEDWLRARGMTRITGPFSFSINEESGLLVDGFDTPPMVMMPHGRPDYAPALESLGFTKAMDLYAFLHEFEEEYHIPPMVKRWKKSFESNPALSIRPLDMKNFKADIALVMDMFNDAWSENWGFIPFSAEQITTMAQELKPLIRSDSLMIALIDGEPAGFTFFLPDINEITEGLNGHILPFGWVQLLYRLKLRGPKRARLPLAGLRRKYHKTRKGMMAMAGSFEAAFAAQHAQGVRAVEASWILETNRDLLNLVDLYEMKRYKTYRVYEKAL